jgi:hypothetical protein
MKLTTLVPIGVLLLAGLGWILTRDGSSSTRGENALPRTAGSPGAGGTSPAPGDLAKPYVPPGLEERAPEARASPASPGPTAEGPAASLSVTELSTPDPLALIERDQALALDRGRSLDERVRAIRNLQSYRLMYDLEGRTSEVLAEADWILEFADDPDVREDLIQGLQGLDNSAIVSPLARVLSEDLDPQVREAAAEALWEHRADPAAAAVLQRAAESDGNERVRVAAGKTR